MIFLESITCHAMIDTDSSYLPNISRLSKCAIRNVELDGRNIFWLFGKFQFRTLKIIEFHKHSGIIHPMDVLRKTTCQKRKIYHTIDPALRTCTVLVTWRPAGTPLHIWNDCGDCQPQSYLWYKAIEFTWNSWLSNDEMM